MDSRVSSRKRGAEEGGEAARVAPAGESAPAGAELARQLERALVRIDDLARQVFALQEQNQQLRKDLANRVCPRLCTKPYRSAS